jgi:hypothetical protein
MDEQFADMLQMCLARLDAGASIEECLAAFPQQRAQLEGPLRTAAQLRTQSWPGMPNPIRTAITSKLHAQVAIQRTGALPAQPTPPSAPPRWSRDPGVILENVIRWLGYQGSLPRVWLRPAAIVLGLALALAVSAGAIAAARAVIQAITPPAQTSAIDTFSLDGVIQQMSPTEWVIEGVPVSVDAQTSITGVPAISAHVTLQGVIQEDGTLYARTATITGTAALTSQPTPALTTVPPTLAATVAVATLAPTSAPTIVAPSAEVPPTSAPPPTNTVSPPVASGDPFAALRALIDAGMSDGRVHGEAGVFLLEKLDEAQTAVGDGKADQLRDRLRDMQQKTREQVREGKMDAGFGQQVLDGIAVIANTYSIQPSDEGDNQKDDNKDKDDKEKDDKGKGN